MKTITIVLCIFLVSCSGKNEVEIPLKKIDFYAFKRSDNKIPEILLKNTKFIKLDNTSDEFLFGSIDKIKISPNRIYILDRKLRKLMAFDSTGKGIGQVGKKGQGPDEYLQIADFDINTSGDIYLLDGIQNKLYVYNEDFDFVEQQLLPFDTDIIHLLPQEEVLFGLCSWNNKEYKGRKILRATRMLDVQTAYLGYDENTDDSYWISHYSFIQPESNIYYNRPIDNMVYEFSAEGELLKGYLFDFGKRNVPDKAKKNIESHLSDYDNYTCLKNFVAFAGNYIMGTIWEGRVSKTFIIDQKANTVYISDEFPDSDISNLAGFHDGHIISFIYPGKYEDLHSMDLPQDIKDYIIDDNFVLCLNKYN